MKTIGLIGGMSWESSAEYYRIINQETNRRLGGVHSAQCLMWSFDFDAIKHLQHEGEWDKLADAMKEAAIRLERGGADFLVVCTNTMHRLADAVSSAVGIPLLHIADPTAEKIKASGFERVGLLGTAFTMERPFLRERLARHGLQVVVPEAADRALVHRVIYDELCLGLVREESRAQVRDVVARLATDGAEGVVLGCTELELLLGADDVDLPLFPTTQLHVAAAVAAALE
jgi:aspartate racemase